MPEAKMSGIENYEKLAKGNIEPGVGARKFSERTKWEVLKKRVTIPLINPGKEAIKNYKKLAEEKIKEPEEIQEDIFPAEVQKKITRIFNRVFKVTSAVLPPVLLTACAAACEKPPVVEEQQQEEEKGQEVVLSETKEETTETTQETTPPVIETPTVIEDEGVIIPPVEGLRYDKETNTFFAEAGNPYGLEIGEKAGVFVKDAVKINGKMENSIALIPKVIEYWEKKMAEEQNEFIYVLPFNFKETQGIEISEIVMASTDKGNKSFNKDPEGHYVLGIKAPIEAKLYAPVSTERYQINFWESFIFKGDKEWAFTFGNLFEGGSFNGNQIDSRWLGIGGAGVEVFLTGKEKQGNFEGELKSEAQIGNLLAKVVKDQYIEFGADKSQYLPADEYQFIIDHYIFQDEKAYDLGSKGLWSIEGTMISILPND